MPKKEPEEKDHYYTIDLGSFGVTAKNEEEAYKKAMKMIRDVKMGWVEIDQILDDGPVED